MHRRLRHRLILIVAAVLTATSAVTYWWMPFKPAGKPLLIDALQLPGGQTLSFMQMRTGSWNEPYKVMLFLTDKSQVFWYYVEHEDFFWWRARLHLKEDGALISLIRNGRECGVFDSAANVLRLPHRVSPANECDRQTLQKWQMHDGAANAISPKR